MVKNAPSWHGLHFTSYIYWVRSEGLSGGGGMKHILPLFINAGGMRQFMVVHGLL